MNTELNPSSSLAPNLLQLKTRRSPAPPVVRWAILAKGFRPLFLLAALHASVMIPIWLLILSGKLTIKGAFTPAVFHGHEMLFGYAGAVLAGFLLTAGGRWSSRETLTGWPLGLLALTWIAGRVASFVGLPAAATALADWLFLPAVAVALGRAIFSARDRRNYAIVAVVGLLSFANALTHLAALGILPGWDRRGLFLGVDLLIVVIVVISARIVPSFTRNATRRDDVRSSPRLDALALALTAASTASNFIVGPSAVTSLLSALAGAALLARARHWGAFACRREPLLWILHVGHGFVALGFLLRALAPMLPLLGGSALHAFTAGGIGCLTLGMMARVTLGHTGRMLTASRATGVMFALISAAATLRILAPLLPAWYFEVLVVAGCAWTLAFALFVAGYARALLRPRVDGQPG